MPVNKRIARSGRPWPISTWARVGRHRWRWPFAVSPTCSEASQLAPTPAGRRPVALGPRASRYRSSSGSKPSSRRSPALPAPLQPGPNFSGHGIPLLQSDTGPARVARFFVTSGPGISKSRPKRSAKAFAASSGSLILYKRSIDPQGKHSDGSSRWSLANQDLDPSRRS